MILKRGPADRLDRSAGEKISPEKPTPELIADAQKSIRKIIVYLAERAAVDDHRQEHGGE